MSNKLQKVLSEIDKVKEKIAVQQTRLRELEQQKTELENMEIVGMVRGLDVAPEELAAFIKAFRGSKAGTPDFMESEDNEHEESEELRLCAYRLYALSRNDNYQCSGGG